MVVSFESANSDTEQGVQRSASQLLQRLSMLLHRENARAIPRRLATPHHTATTTLAATLAEDAAERNN